MAYRHFEVHNSEIQETHHPITADYDELVSASIKRFPFELNEQISTRFTRETFITFSEFFSQKTSRATAKQKIIQGTAELIYKYEEQEKREYRDKSFLSQMGVVNAWELAGKTYLKHETAGATNHGPETNNPWPEPLNPGNYIAYLPDGKIVLLKDEYAICEFINTWRKAGFPLDVNLKWSWDIDKDGNLFIPEHRLDWNKVREKLEDLKIELFGIKEAQKELLEQFGLKYSKHNRELIKNPNYTPADLEYVDNYLGDKSKLNENVLREIFKNEKAIHTLPRQYESEAEIINLKVTIEKLRLEPDIIYNFSSYFSPEENAMVLNVPSDNTIMEISVTIKTMERKHREAMLELYSCTFVEKQKEFRNEFGQNPIITNQMLLAQQQNQQLNVQSSHASSSSSSTSFNRNMR